MSLAFQDMHARNWDKLLRDNTCGAIKEACCTGDADALLAILKSPKVHVFRFLCMYFMYFRMYVDF